jgi:hypothetical protein
MHLRAKVIKVQVTSSKTCELSLALMVFGRHLMDLALAVPVPDVFIAFVSSETSREPVKPYIIIQIFLTELRLGLVQLCSRIN